MAYDCAWECKTSYRLINTQSHSNDSVAITWLPRVVHLTTHVLLGLAVTVESNTMANKLNMSEKDKVLFYSISICI